MLSIGEFSKICKVSTKTLRYYAEIGLILPSEINPENGYRYYSIEQLETMLFIIRLKSYNFSLEEIKQIMEFGEFSEEKLYAALTQKKENKGLLYNRQIVSEKWVSESTQVQSIWETRNLKYGYLWWIIDEEDCSFAALGDGGNAIYVNAKDKIVVAISSLFVPRVKDRVDFIKNDIEPIFKFN